LSTLLFWLILCDVRMLSLLYVPVLSII